jgi:hypothetical protein
MEERGNAKMTTLSSEVLLQSLVPYPREPTLPTLSSSSRRCRPGCRASPLVVVVAEGTEE